MHVGGECEEHNVRSELGLTSQGPEVHREQQASASVSRTVIVAIWLVVVFWRRNVRCFLSVSPSLSLIKQMDVSEAVCPSYRRVFCVDLWAKTPSCPWAALSPAVLTPALINSTAFSPPSRLAPSHHSVSLPSKTCVHTQTHTHKHAATDRALSVLPEVNSHIGSNSTDGAEWASLSCWLAFAPRVD